MKIHQSVKKRKFDTRMNNEAIAIGKNTELKEKSSSVKIRKLESNNRDVDRYSDESCIDESFDSLRLVEILSMHSCSTSPPFLSFLFFAQPL